MTGNLLEGIVGHELVVIGSAPHPEGKIVEEPRLDGGLVTLVTETGEFTFYNRPSVNGQGHTELPGDLPRKGIIIYNV
jgi:hypothetical protein